MAYPQTAFASTTVSPDSLIGRRRSAVSSNTLLYQLKVLKETGRYDAFKLKWHKTYDEPPEVSGSRSQSARVNTDVCAGLASAQPFVLASSSSSSIS